MTGAHQESNNGVQPCTCRKCVHHALTFLQHTNNSQLQCGSANQQLQAAHSSAELVDLLLLMHYHNCMFPALGIKCCSTDRSCNRNQIARHKKSNTAVCRSATHLHSPQALRTCSHTKHQGSCGHQAIVDAHDCSSEPWCTCTSPNVRSCCVSHTLHGMRQSNPRLGGQQ